MDPRAYRDGRVELVPLDDVGLARECAASPERKLLSAIDLLAWVDGLAERDQQLLEGKAIGQTLTEIANGVGRSVAWTHGRVKALGRELAQRAGVEVDQAA